MDDIRHGFIMITLQARGQKDYVPCMVSARPKQGWEQLCSWFKRLDKHLAELSELLRTPDFLRE